MAKPLPIDLALVPRSAHNLAPRALGPGHLRLAADESDTPTLWIYGDIGGWWDGVNAEDTVRELATLDADEINVRINSPGGSVFDGVSIYNALVMHKATVNVYIEGLAASIASIIAMAGDRRYIGAASNVMIHPPWTVMAGGAASLRKEADLLDVLEAGLVDVYEARSGGKRSEIQDWVAAETWFRGQAAIDAGFADELIAAKGNKENRKAMTHTRSALLPLFKNTPKDVLPPEHSSADVRALESFLCEAEGLSRVQARRVIAAAKTLHPELRDVARSPAAADPAAAAPAAAAPAAPAEASRDGEALAELARLKNLFKV